MKKIYLVHCWDGTSNDGWYPWIVNRLNNDNTEVIKFDMPNTSNPNISEWVSTLDLKVEDLIDIIKSHGNEVHIVEI